MIRAVLFAALAAIVLTANADQLDGRAQISYEQYDYGLYKTNGVQQTGTIDLRKNLDALQLHLYLREHDFRGTSTEFNIVPRDTKVLQLQPIGELLFNLPHMQFQAREDYLDTRFESGGVKSGRSNERTSARFGWMPDNLPVFSLAAQRNRTIDDNAKVDLTDETGSAALTYDRRGLTISASERYGHLGDPLAGYDRKSYAHYADLVFSRSFFNDKVTAYTTGNATFTRFDETSLSNRATPVPTPVAISRALFAIDDTPLDSNDHPPQAVPALLDKDVTSGSGISFSPDAVSFQNIVLDLGHVDRIDEVWLFVRDQAGEPVRDGGAVTFDVYSSTDGQRWTQVQNAATSFKQAQSLYAVAFDLTNTRWLKVVNFSVNVQITLLTELQAYYHTVVPPGQTRRTTAREYNGLATFSAKPADRLTIGYSGVFNGAEQTTADKMHSTSRDLEHVASAQYDITKSMYVRGEYARRDVRLFTGADEFSDGLTAQVRFIPNRRLDLLADASRRNEMQLGRKYQNDSRGFHVTTYVLPSFRITADVVADTQSGFEITPGHRLTIGGGADVRLFPSLQLIVTARRQTTTYDATSDNLQLLGATRDNRYDAEFVWHPGTQLTLRARYGWVAGEDVSGFTQRYHADWYPFAGGSLSIGGSYDQDIDPFSDRKSRRMIFSPRWTMNRHVFFDLNYTSVTSTVRSQQTRQRNLLATVTLRK